MTLEPRRFSLKNGRLLTPILLSSGQPEAGTLQALKSAGVRHIVNLRPADEDPSLAPQQPCAAPGLT